MLLASSSGEDLPLAELEQRTDLPVTVHEAIEWRPYDSGYPLGGRWYALTRTGLDPAATRPGQVITHALLFDGEEASRLASLREMRTLLPRVPVRRDSVELLVVEETPPSAQAVQKVSDARIRTTLAALLEAALERKTVAWRGQEGFDDAVDEIWTHLWPAARRGFSFRLAFRPDDMEADTPTLVAVPDAAARLWWHGHPMIEDGRVAADPAQPGLAYLTGAAGGATLAGVLEAFGGELTDLESLLRLESAATRYRDLSSLNAGDARGLARLVGLLSPDPARGIPAKAQILDRLIESTATAPAAAILGLRNLDLDPFRGGIDRIRSIVESWAHRELSLSALRPADEIVAVIRSVTEEGAADAGPWADTGVPAVECALGSITPDAAVRVWEVWERAPALVPVFTESTAFTSMLPRIASACPALISVELSAVVRTVARERRWADLHASVAAAALPAPQGVDAHLAAFPDGNGLEILADRLAPPDRVREAIRTGAAPLIGAAVDAIVSDPELLVLGSADAASWQDLVSRAAILDPEIWTRLPESDRFARGVLSRIREGTSSAEAQHALAHSPFASLLAEPDRGALWTRLDPHWREVFLRRTAEAYLTDLWEGRPVPTALEPALRTAVWFALREQLAHGRVPEAETMAIMARALPELDEGTFIRWLRMRLQRSLLATSAELIGGAIQDRQWAGAARIIARTLNDGRRDLHPAFEQCSHLLDTWTRWMTTIFLSPGGEGEHLWWRALEEVLISLYPTGPMEREVWSRASGDTDVLDLQGSGRDQWHRAVELLRKRGGGKYIGPRALLRAMERDYPQNEQLRDLINRGF